MNHFQILSDGTVQTLDLPSQQVPIVVADVISLLIRENQLDLAQHILSYYIDKKEK